jgi:hypothetical protein
VRDAARLEGQAKPTKDRSYPPADKVRFWLLTFRGVKTFEDDRSAVEGGSSKYSALFKRAEDVLDELRLATEGK